MGHSISCRIQRNDRSRLTPPRRRSQSYSIFWQSIAGVLLVLLAIAVAVPASSQSPSPSAIAPPKPIPSPAASTPQAITQPLRIATRLVKPDAFEENGQIVGFSIDLGRGLLKQLQREAALKPYANTAEVLNAVRSGQVDLGLGAIALIRQREQEFDFSHPILSAPHSMNSFTPSPCPGIVLIADP